MAKKAKKYSTHRNFELYQAMMEIRRGSSSQRQMLKKFKRSRADKKAHAIKDSSS